MTFWPRFNRQEWLYTLSLVILILPNLLFSLLLSLTWIEGMALLALPASLYMGGLLLFKKPGYGLWFFFPLLLLNGFQLVLLFLFGASHITTDMFYNLMVADGGEAKELVGSILPLILLACFIYLPPLYFAVRSIRSKITLSPLFIRYSLSVAIVLFCLGAATAGRLAYVSGVESNIYPINAINNATQAGELWSMVNSYPQRSESFTFDAQRKKQGTQREIHLLVVGETSRAQNWELYGYPRPTNPLLSQRDDLLLFRNVLTQSNFTHRIVPLILTAADASNPRAVYDQKSIISAFKEAGFETFMFTNQPLSGGVVDWYRKEPHHLVSLYNSQSITYDGDMLPHLKQAIATGDNDLFILMHCYGSHYEYAKRTPPDQAYFTPNMASRFNAENLDLIRNDYDNSIRYTDYFLNECIELLSQSGAAASMLYISDHGEDLMDDSRHLQLHCSELPTYYQLHVPMVAWFSPRYRRQYPAMVAQAESHTSEALSSNVVFHTMLSIGHVDTPYLLHRLSVVDADFVASEQMFVGNNYKIMPISAISFTPQEQEKLRHWASR